MEKSGDRENVNLFNYKCTKWECLSIRLAPYLLEVKKRVLFRFQKVANFQNYTGSLLFYLDKSKFFHKSSIQVASVTECDNCGPVYLSSSLGKGCRQGPGAGTHNPLLL